MIKLNSPQIIRAPRRKRNSPSSPDAGNRRKRGTVPTHPRRASLPQLSQAIATIAREGGAVARRAQPEQQVQRAVIDHLHWRARPGVWFCHLANGGARSRIESAIFRSLGVRPGAPDLLIVADGKAHFLELKAPGRKLSPTQTACHASLQRAGATVETADNIDTALAFLARMGVMR